MSLVQTEEMTKKKWHKVMNTVSKEGTLFYRHVSNQLRTTHITSLHWRHRSRFVPCHSLWIFTQTALQPSKSLSLEMFLLERLHSFRDQAKVFLEKITDLHWGRFLCSLMKFNTLGQPGTTVWTLKWRNSNWTREPSSCNCGTFLETFKIDLPTLPNTPTLKHTELSLFLISPIRNRSMIWVGLNLHLFFYTVGIVSIVAC